MTFIIETPDAQSIGYVTLLYEVWNGQFRIAELNLIDGQSYRAVLPTILRWVKPIAEAAAKDQHVELDALYFMFGEQHPLYDAAPDQFQKIKPPYAWYVRVPDVPKFINTIAPVLEARLARSGLAGYSGTLKVTEYVRGFQLIFERGKIRSEAWTPDDSDNAMFPPYTFNQLLFGRRSLAELRFMYPDCLLNADAAAMLDVLFPKRTSEVCATA